MMMVNRRNQAVVVRDLEIASSMKQRLVGLLGRSALPEGGGLLIKRSGNSIHTFFMKFSIDLVFMNREGTVKHVAKNVKPWRMIVAPLILQTDCLELPAGTVDKSDIRIGDTLRVEA